MASGQDLEQKLSLLFELNPLAAIELDINFRVVAWNRAATEIFGYTKEEAIGRYSPELMVPKKNRALIGGMFQDLFVQPTSSKNTNENITKTGEIIICDWHDYSLIDAEGRLTGVLSIVQNVTAQKETEEVLRQQEEQLQQSEKRFQALTEAKLLETQNFLESVLENLPVAVFAKDAQDLSMIWWNRASEKLFDIKAEEILDTKTHDWFSPEDLELYNQQDREALHSLGMIDIPEDIIRNRQGETRILHTRKIPILDAEGVPQSLLVICEDITERKATEQQLKEQSAILQAFIDHTPVPIAMFDREMRYLVANQCWLVDNNLAGQNIIGRSQYDIFPNLPDRWKEGHQRCLAGATESREADPFPRADGSVDYVRWQILPWWDAQGEIGGILMYSEIVTERIKAEEERQNLAAIVSNTSDFIGIASLEGNTLYVNPAGLNLVGLDNLEVARTKQIIDFYAPQEHESIIQRNNPAVIPESGLKEQRSFRHFVTGEEIPIDTNIFLVRDPVTNQPLYLAAIIRDRREARAAEQQLQHKANREELLNRMNNKIRSSLDFNEILEKAVTEIRAFFNVDNCQIVKYIPVNLDPNHQDHQTAYWEVMKKSLLPGLADTPNRYQSIAIIADKVLNLDVLRIDNADTCQDVPMQKALQLIGFKSVIFLPYLLTDNLFICFSCINYQQPRQWLDEEVDLLEAVMEQLAIALNQSELYQKAESRAKELEEILQELRRTQGQLVQSEKMSSLGQLVAGVAHEINNPVNFIYGNLAHASEYSQELIQLLKLYQKYYPDPVPEIEEEAETIDLEFILTDLPSLLSSMKIGADRIKEIVLSLRNFSRMDEAAMKAVDIHEGIDSTLMILQNRLKVKSSKPEIAIVKDYGELPLIECYAGELNQVFMNILSNAIDALEECDQQINFAEGTQNPRHIQISTTLLIDSKNRQVQIKISDNGMGISESVQKKLFDPFFTTKEVGKGTGLGLSISYQVVTERHNGSLTCESELGVGTSFIIKIPLQR